MKKPATRTVYILILAMCVVLAVSCVSSASSAPLPVSQKTNTPGAAVEALLVRGGPGDLIKAKTLLDQDASLVETTKQAYRWLVMELARLVYPSIAGAETTTFTFSPDDNLLKRFIDARNGITGDVPESAGPLELVLSMTGVFRQRSSQVLAYADALVNRFKKLSIPSVLVSLVEGIILESRNDNAGALPVYQAAYSMDEQCYPALYGSVRILLALDRSSLALELLDASVFEFKSSLEGKRYRALALFAQKRYAEADPLIVEVLKANSFDSVFLLMKAQIHIENGNYREASTLLNAYSKLNVPNAVYFYLQARITEEFVRNNTEAKSVLRNALVQYPDDPDLRRYLAELLAKGSKEEQNEALSYAMTLLARFPDDRQVLRILLSLQISAKNFNAAQQYAEKLLSLKAGFSDYELIIRAYRGGGKLDLAEKLTDTWLAAEPNAESALLLKVGLMVDRKQDRQKILDFITNLLAQKGRTSLFRSNLYVLQAQLQTSTDDQINSLRLALVESNTNISALLALYDIYFAQKDYQRARFYLLQAYSLAPDLPEIASRREKIGQVGFKVP